MSPTILPKPKAGEVTLWVVYNSPKDYPGMFVARQHTTSQGATSNCMASTEHDNIETFLQGLGLVRTCRHVADDPVIKEVWL